MPERNSITPAQALAEIYPKITVTKRRTIAVPTTPIGALPVVADFFETRVEQDPSLLKTVDANFDDVKILQLSKDKKHFLAIGTRGNEKFLMRDNRVLLSGDCAYQTCYPTPNLENFYVISQSQAASGDQELFIVNSEGASLVHHGAQIRRGNIVKNIGPPIKVFVVGDESRESALFVDQYSGVYTTPVANADKIVFPTLEGEYAQFQRAIAYQKDGSIYVAIISTGGTKIREVKTPLKTLPDKVILRDQEIVTSTKIAKDMYSIWGEIEGENIINIADSPEQPQIETVGALTLALRYISKIGSPVFGSEVLTKPGEDPVAEFAKLLDEGYGGVIIEKHFSLRNAVQDVKDIVLKNKVLIRRILENFIAKHQFNVGVKFLGYFLKGYFNSIATDKTRAKAAEKGKPIPPRDDGLREATKKIMETLRHGGILILYPETFRTNELLEYYLPPYGKRTVGYLMAKAKRAGIKLAFLVVDERRANMQQGYWDKSRFNPLDGDLHPFEKFQVYPSETFTDKQLLRLARGNFGKVDWIVHRRMKKAQEEASNAKS